MNSFFTNDVARVVGNLEGENVYCRTFDRERNTSRGEPEPEKQGWPTRLREGGVQGRDDDPVGAKKKAGSRPADSGLTFVHVLGTCTSNHRLLCE